MPNNLNVICKRLLSAIFALPGAYAEGGYFLHHAFLLFYEGDVPNGYMLSMHIMYTPCRFLMHYSSNNQNRKLFCIPKNILLIADLVIHSSGLALYFSLNDRKSKIFFTIPAIILIGMYALLQYLYKKNINNKKIFENTAFKNPLVRYMCSYGQLFLINFIKSLGVSGLLDYIFKMSIGIFELKIPFVTTFIKTIFPLISMVFLVKPSSVNFNINKLKVFAFRFREFFRWLSLFYILSLSELLFYRFEKGDRNNQIYISWFQYEIAMVIALISAIITTYISRDIPKCTLPEDTNNQATTQPLEEIIINNNLEEDPDNQLQNSHNFFTRRRDGSIELQVICESVVIDESCDHSSRPTMMCESDANAELLTQTDIDEKNTAIASQVMC